MTSWTFLILGEPRVLKNSKTICARGRGRPVLVSSKEARSWASDAVESLTWQARGARFKGLVQVSVVSYLGTRRVADLDNSISGPLDALVKAGILETDSNRQVVSLDGSRLLYDKDRPRVEITITECGEKQQQPWRTTDAKKGTT